MGTLSYTLERHFGWLARLRRNRAGNTLAMLAIAILPLAGLLGGAVDMSRMYLTKTRMQQACDAGALSGRKAMGGGTWGQSSFKPRTIANEFFDGNFREGDYGTENLDREYTERAGKVSGTATADVPMTLMQIFKRGTQTLTVVCDAEMRLPNTDVMFVLDTTGSMGETLSGDSKTKLAGLKVAVKCFYEIVARLNSNAACEGGDPSGGTGSEVQVRFGFTPFSTNVNVGRVLPSDWFADRWTYQSREPVFIFGRTVSYSDSDESTGGWTTVSVTPGLTEALCAASKPVNLGASAQAEPKWPGFNRNGDPEWNDTRWIAEQPFSSTEYRTSWNKRPECYIQKRTTTWTRRSLFERVVSTYPGATRAVAWRYAPIEFDLRPLKNGSGWNSAITLPVGDKATNRSVGWSGCIEERETVSRSSYSPIDAIKSDAVDLDIDRVPDGSQRTQWKPALGGVIYPRRVDYRDPRINPSEYTNNFGGYDLDPIVTFTDYTGEDAACGTAARKLQQWPSASTFDSYVDSLAATGNTYHDIGLLWGARLISPTGLFRAENEFTPKGGEIERHVIFMTDGDACTSVSNYQAYGLNWFDRRTTGAGTPTDGCTTTGTITQQVNARTAALCNAVKNKNITLWVVWFGEKNAYIEGAMEACATEGNFFVARDSKQLQEQFRAIADKISQLRLTA